MSIRSRTCSPEVVNAVLVKRYPASHTNVYVYGARPRLAPGGSSVEPHPGRLASAAQPAPPVLRPQLVPLVVPRRAAPHQRRQEDVLDVGRRRRHPRAPRGSCARPPSPRHHALGGAVGHHHEAVNAGEEGGEGGEAELDGERRENDGVWGKRKGGRNGQFNI